MTIYHVTVELNEPAWLIHVHQLNRSTHAPRIAEVEPMIRDLISAATGEDIDAVEFEVDLRIPSAAQGRVQPAQRR